MKDFNRGLSKKHLKPKTIFCDIDGTLVKYHGDTRMITLKHPVPLPGVVDKINEWELNGHHIILTTGRRESLRERTATHLQAMGIPYDILLMGITSGYRVLINDKNTSGDDSCFAVNLKRDEGFSNTQWSDLGL
tara:strand:- start:2279 stop:2680 length:402 start_codon:yes stop_codon:yes gene_type:complete